MIACAADYAAWACAMPCGYRYGRRGGLGFGFYFFDIREYIRSQNARDHEK
jgi:hypothetical protein